MSTFQNKINFMEKHLENQKLVKENFDLDEEVILYIQNLAKEYNTTFNIIVNIILRDMIIYHMKNEEKNFKEVLDTYEFLEKLEEENFEIKEPILVINYENYNQKVVAINPNDYEKIHSIIQEKK